MITVQDVRQVARGLPRGQEHLIHDRVKFRVGRIVYLVAKKVSAAYLAGAYAGPAR